MSIPRRTLLALVVTLGFALFPWELSAERSAVVVVISRDSPLSDVSSAELRKLFLRNTNTVNGRELVPFNHPPGSAVRVQFDRGVLKMSEAEVGRYWVDRRIRGESGPPHVVPNAKLMLALVKRFPGAIGYLRAEEADNSVRVLRVDGKLPGAAEYALK